MPDESHTWRKREGFHRQRNGGTLKPEPVLGVALHDRVIKASPVDGKKIGDATYTVIDILDGGRRVKIRDNETNKEEIVGQNILKPAP